MIRCTINGNLVYPSTSEKIKVTYENQFVKDSGSYTYDISFPMSIHENQILFGNVHRFDVKKMLASFDDCKLYADNRLIMSGKGTVTSITSEIVKLQIIGGKSRVKYNSNFESHYIDEIDYPDVVITHGIDKEGYAQLNMTSVKLDVSVTFVMVDLTSWNYVGQPGVAAFNPINDETNNTISNNLIVFKPTKIKVNGVNWPTGKAREYMYNLAVQPNLVFILKTVLEKEGYSIARNDIDVEPWNRILIASARKSVKIKDALPHWSVYSFIEEIRKLFNVSFVFDEVNKSVSIIDTNELTSNEIANYDCTDDFSCEYDEDGLNNLSTSNLQYDFNDASERDWREVISQSVQKTYTTKEFENIDSLVSLANSMSTKDRRSTIFKLNGNYYVYAMLPKDGHPDTEDKTEQRTQCGFFNPVLRDIDSDDFVDIKISPVAMYMRHKWPDNATIWQKLLDGFPNKYIAIPSTTNDKESSLDDMTADDDGEYYMSVQDSMEYGSSESTTQESEDEKIAIMFQGINVFSVEKQISLPYVEKFGDENTLERFPVTITDYRMFPFFIGQSDISSLSLNCIQGGKELVEIDKHNLITIKFITNDIPDPANIYLFRNKRYICQKIEMEVSDDGINEMKTGYFYEII
jgi:hypothetical protein